MRLPKPSSWKIKHRLLAAGAIISVVAILNPMYMRSRLSELNDTYRESAAQWQAFYEIREFNQYFADSEFRLHDYVAHSNLFQIEEIEHNNEIIKKNLAELWYSTSENKNYTSLYRDIFAAYQKWMAQVHKQMPSEILAATKPLSVLIHVSTDKLAENIKLDSVKANQSTLNASKNVLLRVTYGGAVFFVIFFALILSLWFTLMPDISNLQEAIREFEKGNLDHRVHIPGRSETAQLGRTFNEMAVSLKAQNEKLKELNQLKTDFVSTVSHELRTPLTAIRGSIGLILGGVTGEIPAEAVAMLQITEKNTNRLIRLISEVLDVAKIEAGAVQMRFDKYSLTDALKNTLTAMEGVAKTRGINLIFESPKQSPLVIIDHDWIEQVLTNLLSNALKFTNAGGTVRIYCELKSDSVVVHIEDTGIGIPDEFLDRIFEKFQQAEHSDIKANEGTGLGLAIAKIIVEEHGGKIWVSSTKGKGSDFAFSLPWNGTEFAENRKKLPQAA